MKLWTNDTDWVWAETIEDVATFWKRHNGEDYEAATGQSVAEGFDVVPDDSTFTLYNEDALRPDEIPPGAVVEGKGTTATVAAWRTVSQPGFFASTEW